MTPRLLVPLDGSQLGERALAWASHLARRRGAELVLVETISMLPVVAGGPMGELGTPEMYEEALAAEQDAVAAYLGTVQARLVGEGLVVETMVRLGNAATTILDIVDELGVELIVMATHGRGGFARAVLGSVATQVIQQATVPVLLVRADDEAARREPALDRLLVPLDGSALAERALDVAAQLGGRDATISLVRVAEPPRTGRGRARSWTTLVEPDGQQAAAAYLDRIVSTAAPAGLRVRPDVRSGPAVDQILAAAASHDVDLIVMATHGRTGPARWWLGSVADAVARRADRPVLLVSARALVARASEPYNVGDVMTREPVSIREDEPAIAAVRKLLRTRVSSLPVLSADGQLVGLISAMHLADWHGRVTAELVRKEAPDPYEYGHRLRTVTVREIMGRPAAVLDETAPLGQAVRLLRERAVSCLPVTHDSRLVGILTVTDVLKTMAARYQALDGLENPSD